FYPKERRFACTDWRFCYSVFAAHQQVARVSWADCPFFNGERPAMKRTAFFISDGTGITVETLGHSLLSQFASISFQQVTIPYVQSDELARQAVARINHSA